ncbi:MAG: lytic murein transglycosylase B [Pseudoxanthomonas suwonensis]|nr:lytic murein transglycosylase B [Pseudoxanthomonas suwonensis]
MIKRLPALLLPLAIAACVTGTPPPVATTVTSAEPVPQADPKPALPAGQVAPVPQPEVRPEAPASVTDPSIPRAQRVDNFVDYAASTYGVDPAFIRSSLSQATYQQRIIDAISRPAEAVRPWKDYRPIFLNDARINGGIAFYRENKAALDKVARDTGVPAEVIVAIIGVETQYGRNMGSWKVLDAIYTLAFDYPRRAPFFAAELAQLFALHKAEPHLPLTEMRGSYAGAMGMGQFMPSSYRLWAKDGDGDARRDLFGSRADIFASIANYFVLHGWQRGEPVVARADKDPNLPEWTPDAVDPLWTLDHIEGKGYRPRAGQPRRDGATVINFEGDAGREYWLGYRNFYVITRYNRSPMYSLAVHQLSQAIRAGAGIP